MLSRFLRYLAAVVVALSMSLPFASGQTEPPEKIERGVKLDLSEGERTPSPALPYFFLLIFTMLVLTVVCMPSRRA